MASIFTEKIDKIRQEFVKLHDAVIKEGKIESTAIDTVFKSGSYVDDREIAILHDVSVEDLRTYLRNVFFSMIINNAWIKQGAYIFSRKLKKEDCKLVPLLPFTIHDVLTGSVLKVKNLREQLEKVHHHICVIMTVFTF